MVKTKLQIAIEALEEIRQDLWDINEFEIFDTAHNALKEIENAPDNIPYKGFRSPFHDEDIQEAVKDSDIESYTKGGVE